MIIYRWGKYHVCNDQTQFYLTLLLLNNRMKRKIDIRLQDHQYFDQSFGLILFKALLLLLLLLLSLISFPKYFI